MSMELLGLIDAIEATIMDCPRMPFSDKIMIQEKKMLEMLAKLRIVAQTGGEAAQRAVKGEQVQRPGQRQPLRKPSLNATVQEPISDTGVKKTVESILVDAKNKAEDMIKGADEYAKDVLTQLLIVTTKIQRTIENGKGKLEKK